MSFERIKGMSRRMGLYRQARWIKSHFLDRSELYREKQDLEFYSQIVTPGRLVFDVGANYGEKTKVFLQLGARVVSFEPQPKCKEELEARIGNNRNLVSLGFALGSMPQQRTFFIRTHNGASGFIEDWKDGIESTIEVPIVTLEDMIKKYGTPDYIKIDVEGFEYEVLKGLNHRIPYISFEYHLKKKSGVEKAVECLDYLSAFGRLKINVTPAENLVFAYPNWIFKEEFLTNFPSSISSREGFGYGDIFVQTEATAE